MSRPDTTGNLVRWVNPLQGSASQHDFSQGNCLPLVCRPFGMAAFSPQTSDLLETGHAVTWNASAGAACSCDTYLVTDKGPKPVTPTEVWPLKRIRIQGAECIRPDILLRP